MANKTKGLVFGRIPGTTVGQIFKDRAELAKAGIHKPTQAGISGGGKESADSIVLSGGYEDDEDFGDIIIYTGVGYREENAIKQTFEQKLISTNLALAKSHLEGFPVRVSRGHQYKSQYSPKEGYEYSGLYRVDDCWREKGRAGFNIWRYRLIACDEQPTQEAPNGHDETKRVQGKMRISPVHEIIHF